MGTINIVNTASGQMSLDNTSTQEINIELPTIVTVTYNHDGGSNPSFTTKQVGVGGLYGGFPTSTKTGYILTSWKYNTTTITSETVVSVNINHTLVAQWTPIQYNISFNGNGSTSGSTAEMTDLNYGTSYTLTTNGFIRDRYIFQGWNTESDGTGTSYTNGQSVSNLSSEDEDTATLYAQWIIDSAQSANQWYYYGLTNPGDQGEGIIDAEYATSSFNCPSISAVKSIALFEYPPQNYIEGTVLNLAVYRNCDPNAEPCLASEGSSGYAYCDNYYFIAAEPNVTATFSGLTGATPSSYPSQSVAPNYQNVVSPGSPTKSGFNFTGWSPSLPRTISRNTNFTAQFQSTSPTPVLSSFDVTISSFQICGFVGGSIDNDNAFPVTAQYKIGSRGIWTTLTTLTANQQNKSFAIGGFSTSPPYSYNIYFRHYNSSSGLYSSQVQKTGTITSCASFGF